MIGPGFVAVSLLCLRQVDRAFGLFLQYPDDRGRITDLRATIDNTRSACRRCHGKVDAPRAHERRRLTDTAENPVGTGTPFVL